MPGKKDDFAANEEHDGSSLFSNIDMASFKLAWFDWLITQRFDQ